LDSLAELFERAQVPVLDVHDPMRSRVLQLTGDSFRLFVSQRLSEGTKRGLEKISRALVGLHPRVVFEVLDHRTGDGLADIRTAQVDFSGVKEGGSLAGKDSTPASLTRSRSGDCGGAERSSD
jgi:hypothetical protein